MELLAQTTLDAYKSRKEELLVLQRKNVYDALVVHGVLCVDEIEHYTGIPQNSLRWRVKELLEQGLIVKYSDRITRSGCRAIGFCTKNRYIMESAKNG